MPQVTFKINLRDIASQTADERFSATKNCDREKTLSDRQTRCETESLKPRFLQKLMLRGRELIGRRPLIGSYFYRDL